MASRADDWMTQAREDLKAAVGAVASESYEWACFISQQAAEKSVKALAQSKGGEAWGHHLTPLLEKVLGEAVPSDIREAAQDLDSHYIQARYPNGWDEGKPADYYSKSKAETAIEYARRIVAFCESHMA